MRNSRRVLLALGALALALVGTPARAAEEEFTSEFQLEECTFSNRGSNALFSLDPGTRLVLEGEDEGEEVRIEITVLNDQKSVTFETAEGETLRVRTRVIEEREWKDGELAEVSLNYFARCRQTDDVFYFGEDVDFYEDGVIVGHEGSWLAGRDGALPGLIMPGRFLLGARYFQEIAPGVALDRAQHVGMGLDVEVPAGEFEDCVEIHETSPLSPGDLSVKLYCPGVGLVDDDGNVLVEYELGKSGAGLSRGAGPAR
jgi:hypothetical protein